MSDVTADFAARQESLRRNWCALLGVEEPTPEQNFFELGGDSMAAMELISRVHGETGCELPLDVLFTDGSLGELESAMR
ncbi:acyl carrier protein [Streptomyces hygroscopicus]|uniref:acyl carrier protein n=1 Tax=Streptomyces hygroscopicus TaxID=1912 RepID=UPI00099FFB14|nr:acyl carrier protein [Streptomyces hygroscopicus]